MKGGRGLAVLLVLSILLLAFTLGCAQKPAQQAQAPAPPPEEQAPAPAPAPAPEEGLPETIKIGVLFALTGELGPIGQEMLKGAKLAVEEINAMGGIAGRRVELVVEDTATDPKKALEGAKKLVEVDGVKVIIGAMASSSTMAIGDYCNERHVVVISPSSTSPLISEKFPDDFIFRVVGSDTFQGKALADIALRLGAKKVALMYINNPYGVGIAKVAGDRLKANGVQIVADIAYDVKKRDFRTELEQIRAANPDAVILVAYVEDGKVICRQAKELGLDSIPWIHAEGDYGAAMLEDPEVADFLYTTSVGTRPVPPFGAMSYKFFEEKFVKRFGHEPKTTYEPYTYDAVWLAALSIAMAGKYDGDAIREALKVVSEHFQGSTGYKKFDKNGDVLSQSYNIWTVEKKPDGTYELVDIGSWVEEKITVTTPKELPRGVKLE